MWSPRPRKFQSGLSHWAGVHFCWLVQAGITVVPVLIVIGALLIWLRL
jgi:hypothetical protein